jgi:hypothetical protein
LGMLVLGVGAAFVGLATWLVFDGRETLAGVAAALSGAALASGAVLTRKHGARLHAFLDSGIDRAFDGCLLSAIALTSRQADPPAAGAAVGALAAGFLGAYVRARGVSLGYPIEESVMSRGIRYALVSVGLGAKVLGPAMFALLGFTLLAAVVRGSQVAKKERE